MNISKKNAEHYTWGNNCDGWFLHKTDALCVLLERMPPGTEEQLHYHEKAQQVFYILKGKAVFEVNGEFAEVNAGESLTILPGVKHRVFNKENMDLEFILVSQPNAHNDRING